MRRKLIPLVVGLASIAIAAQVWAQDPLPDIQRGSIAVMLQPVAMGVGAPDYGTHPPGDATRLFVLEQKGTILVILNGSLLPTPALDIQARVAPPLNPANANDERGLLGLAFHPGYQDPGSVGFRTLYTFHTELIPIGTLPTYVAPNNATMGYKTVVDEWKIDPSNPNVIDPTSRREVISFGKNANNHNGGTVAFGPDGYMYLALGDGGNANDVGASHIEPGGNAQNLTTPLGKMLRFDPVNPALTPGSPDPVSPNGQYRIPVSNPFDGPGEVPEIYARGLRNPYRFAFDTLNGELILADVGQNNIEEIDRINIGGNYGWAVKEGDFLFNRSNGTIGARSPGLPDSLIDPLSGPLGTLEYDHTDGISITGGFMYRGAGIPELYGKYVFGDLAIRNAPPRVDGRLFYADLASGEILEFLLPQFPNDQLPNSLTVHGFGQDGAGELYAMVTNTPANGTGGIVYKFMPVEPTAVTLSAFVADAEEDGIRLRWQFGEASDVTAVQIERADFADGPWSEIETERRLAGDMEEALDRSVSPGATYHYRLVVNSRSDGETTLPSISATARGGVASLALTRVSPNPSAGRLAVDFVLSRAGHATLRLLDLQGRAVATLASGARTAGPHRVTWDAGAGIPAGLYFVELQAGGTAATRRVALAP